MASKEKWKEKPECVRLWNRQFACWFAVNVWKSESSQSQSVCLCTQLVLWFISDKGNMMCQFVSLTPSSSLSSLKDRLGLGGGGGGGPVMEGWREEGDCALPKVELACVGRGWRDGVVALLGTAPIFLLCSHPQIKLSALVYCGPRLPSTCGPLLPTVLWDWLCLRGEACCVHTE